MKQTNNVSAIFYSNYLEPCHECWKIIAVYENPYLKSDHVSLETNLKHTLYSMSPQSNRAYALTALTWFDQKVLFNEKSF